MSHAQHMRGSAAMSRDIDAKAKARRRDPAIERLEASRDIAHKERDAALTKVAEVTAELEAARRCLRSARASHSIAFGDWERERADLKFRLHFAAEHIRKISGR